jgi:type II secretory pathway component HofQ
MFLQPQLRLQEKVTCTATPSLGMTVMLTASIATATPRTKAQQRRFGAQMHHAPMGYMKSLTEPKFCI